MVLHLFALASLLQGTPDFQWHKVIAPGKTVEIKGVNGAVRATASSGKEVEVVAVKRARRSDPDSVKIEVVETSDGVVICAVYPSRRGNRCAGGEGGMNSENNDVSVAFTVKIPAGVRFKGRTVNGDISATGLTADATVHTVNGSAEVSTTGRAEAGTVNGDVRATMGRLGDGDLAFTTVNGSVDVTIPADAKLDVHASTTNGDISTDFDLVVRGRFGPRSLRGSINGGGRSLRVSTVNGRIELRKRG